MTHHYNITLCCQGESEYCQVKSHVKSSQLFQTRPNNGLPLQHYIVQLYSFESITIQ